MDTIELKTEGGSSKIIIGGHLEDVWDLIPNRKVVVITDSTVNRLYGNAFSRAIVIEVEPGEQSKTVEKANQIYDQLLNHEIDRKDFILGIGGGVVCDLSGFIASTYLRGISFGFVATTMLAQVDASIGGKNGVNFKGYKNIIGVIRQPQFVLCDLKLLKTLEKIEYIGGLSEVIKYGAIMDRELFDYFEDNVTEILSQDTEILKKLVFNCVRNKTIVVEKDENETGERMKLNFGHTFAHALEKITGLSHGEAVGIGMNVAARISEKLGFLSKENTDRLRNIIQKIGLPVSLEIKMDLVYEVIRKDKKKSGDEIGLILLNDLGDSFTHYIELDELKNIMNDLH